MEKEEWRDIPGILYYQVSDLGRVRRSAPGHKTFSGKILKFKHHVFGYPSVALTIKGKAISFQVHRLVAFAFIGPAPSGKNEVAHFDNSRTNNVPSNLRWASRKENNDDRFRHGTNAKGEKNGMSKLTPEKVLEIRQLRADGETLMKIASRFGVDFRTISKIALGQRWRHL